MKELRKIGLFGEGLTKVSTPELVKRYNACLREIGIEPTKLSSFSIDGIGWSPEIAHEKKDNYYLSHSGANQFIIIMSPLQKGKPPYFPYHSFMRDLMRTVFEGHMRQIADVTTETDIWLDIEEDISHYLGPLDLLMIDSIVVKVNAVNGIIENAKNQRDLVSTFLNDDDAWFDPDHRKKLMESAEKHGDLRYRSVIIPDIPFGNVRSFYTMAFGGVYVFRDNMKMKDFLMVVEDEEVFQDLGSNNENIISISDREILVKLLEVGLLDIDVKYYLEKPELINIKLDCIFMDVLTRFYPDIDYTTINPAKRKKLITDLKQYLPQCFFDLERFAKRIKRDSSINIDQISIGLMECLIHPARNLDDSLRDVLWKLITEVRPLDVLRFYIHNKQRFFEFYKDWPNSKRKWAANLIKTYYNPKFRE